MPIQIGDIVEYLEAWRNSLETGTVIGIEKSPRGFKWLFISGRERPLPIDRVERVIQQRKEAA